MRELTENTDTTIKPTARVTARKRLSSPGVAPAQLSRLGKAQNALDDQDAGEPASTLQSGAERSRSV